MSSLIKSLVVIYQKYIVLTESGQLTSEGIVKKIQVPYRNNSQIRGVQVVSCIADFKEKYLE